MAKVVLYEKITEEHVSTVESKNAFPLGWKKVSLFLVFHIIQVWLWYLKCFLLFYNVGWLRTDEEILKMKEQKLAASNTKPQEVPMVVDDEPVAAIAAPLVQKEPAAEPQPAYQPKLEDISFYLSQEDVRIIENIVECYWKAYKYEWTAQFSDLTAVDL